MAPVGLNENAVDLFDIDGACLVADGFEEGCNTEVAGAAQTAFGRTHDEVECGFGEGVVTESTFVELIEDEVAGLVGVHGFEDDGVGDA